MRYTESLARLIARETGAAEQEIEPWVAAHALLGVHRALIDHVRRRTLAGARAGELAPELQALAKQAFELLEKGLGDYAVK